MLRSKKVVNAVQVFLLKIFYPHVKPLIMLQASVVVLISKCTQMIWFSWLVLTKGDSDNVFAMKWAGVPECFAQDGVVGFLQTFRLLVEPWATSKVKMLSKSKILSKSTKYVAQYCRYVIGEAN